MLVNKMDAANYSSADAKKLLEICRVYTYDSHQHTIIIQIWQQLRKRGGLQREHYNEMLSYCSKAGLTNETQQIFDEMTEIGFKRTP